ncbi:MAG: hypothetical protein GWN66_11325 [Pseudomonas stutzeri]|nr:hypothetical protein [Stutzerimonas stutzeri]
MRARRCAVLLALGLLFLSRPAPADTPVVYDLGAGPTGVKLVSSSAETVELRIDLGSDPSTGSVCQDGDGDELCAADVRVTLDGPGEIVGFAAGSGVVYAPDPFTATTTLRLNVLQSLDPPVPGPQDLGTLTIDASGHSPGNPIRVDVSGQAVDAAGKLVTIPTRTIAVPEPSDGVLLVSGILGLGVFQWLRGRRAASGARARCGIAEPGARPARSGPQPTPGSCEGGP